MSAASKSGRSSSGSASVARPLLKWAGGKRQLLDSILARLPDEIDTYYEPFVGGGAVFFDFAPQHAVLSDMNAELITTYKVIKNNVEDLIHSLHMHVYEKEFFLNMRAKKITDLTDLEIASRFIYLNRTCFNGMYRVNNSGQFNVPFGRYDNPQICDEVNLRRVSTALNGAKIMHADYTHVLQTAQKGDFIYFDPPYHPLNATSSFTSYTVDGFTADDQKRLRDTFVELSWRGCFVMLSNSDTPLIRDLYTLPAQCGITTHTVSAGRNINSNSAKRGKVNELVVTNY
jgi:DNA adenine methylase